MKLAYITNPEFKTALIAFRDSTKTLKQNYMLNKMLKAIGQELEDFEKIRLEILNKYGEKDKDGKLDLKKDNNAKFTPENMKLFSEAYIELLNIDVEIPLLDLEEFAGLDLSFQNYQILMGLFKNEEQEHKVLPKKIVLKEASTSTSEVIESPTQESQVISEKKLRKPRTKKV